MQLISVTHRSILDLDESVPAGQARSDGQRARQWAGGRTAKVRLTVSMTHRPRIDPPTHRSHTGHEGASHGQSSNQHAHTHRVTHEDHGDHAILAILEILEGMEILEILEVLEVMEILEILEILEALAITRQLTDNLEYIRNI